jgi:Na+-transporting NADH:ubiquinone oxidoreductase subunit A
MALTSRWSLMRRGLALAVDTPPTAVMPVEGVRPAEALTEEAALIPPRGTSPRIEMLVEEGALVAEGAPVARLRHAPEVVFVAPMPARVAAAHLLPGRRMGEIVLFREAGGDVHRHADASDAPEALLPLLQRAGFWPRLRRRPYGGMPPAGERPAAILVMGCDTRPLAPHPADALARREEALARGLAALADLTDGPVFLCEDSARPLGVTVPGVQSVPTVARHPQGLPGIRIAELCPADSDHPVWDLDAEDVADIGDLLATGHLPQRRVVRVVGPALTETRLVTCQIGADTRGLSYGAIRPGPHTILAGSPIDGRPAHWLGPRDRQVTVMDAAPPETPPHWFIAALTRSSRPRPIIPSAALMQAVGGAFPAMAMLRALGAGDDETALKLGALSLLEEDLALVDYVTGGTPRAADLLRGLLDRTRAEEGA